MKNTIIKYAMGFGVFLAYYLIARNLENRIALVQRAANVGR